MGEHDQRICPTSQRAINCLIQSTANSFPECVTSYHTLNNLPPKNIESNGVCRRLMENYQPRMKVSCVLDLLCAFSFDHTIGTIIIFITAAYSILCEQFINVLLFSLQLSIIFCLHTFSSFFFRCDFILLEKW